MPDNRTTDSEDDLACLDTEDWQIAFEPYEEHPYAALRLALTLRN